MRTVILGIETQSELTRRILATARGQQKVRWGPDLIREHERALAVLAPKRVEIVRAMTVPGRWRSAKSRAVSAVISKGFTRV